MTSQYQVQIACSLSTYTLEILRPNAATRVVAQPWSWVFHCFLNCLFVLGRESTGGNVGMNIFVVEQTQLPDQVTKLEITMLSLHYLIQSAQYFAPQDTRRHTSPECWELMMERLPLGAESKTRSSPTKTGRELISESKTPQSRDLEFTSGVHSEALIPLSPSSCLSATVKSTFAVLDMP